MAVAERAQATVQKARQSGLGRFVAKYGEDRADDHAALIAFTALFSIFPLIGALLTLLGFVVRDPATLDVLREAISQQFPGQVADLLSFLQETREISGLLGVVSLLGFLWSGSALFGTMARAFNTFYGLSNRGFLGQRIMAFVMIFVFLILIVISVAASSLAAFLLAFSAQLPFALPGRGLLEGLIGWGVSFLAAWLLFLALYRVVPNGPLSLGRVWPGALLGAGLFLLLIQLFPLYLSFFGGGFAAYKTLGLFLLLMTWFYFLARILVLGCELNAFWRPLPRPAEVAVEPVAPAAPERTERHGLKERVLELAVVAGLVLLVARRPRRD